MKPFDLPELIRAAAQAIAIVFVMIALYRNRKGIGEWLAKAGDRTKRIKAGAFELEFGEPSASSALSQVTTLFEAENGNEILLDAFRQATVRQPRFAIQDATDIVASLPLEEIAKLIAPAHRYMTELLVQTSDFEVQRARFNVRAKFPLFEPYFKYPYLNYDAVLETPKRRHFFTLIYYSSSYEFLRIWGLMISMALGGLALAYGDSPEVPWTLHVGYVKQEADDPDANKHFLQMVDAYRPSIDSGNLVIHMMHLPGDQLQTLIRHGVDVYVADQVARGAFSQEPQG